MFLRTTRQVLLACVCLGLLVSLVACNNAPASSPTQPVDGQVISAGSPIATSTTPPSVQVSCPAQGTARAAVMPAMTLGNHATVVYVWNQTGTAMLRRYDATNGSKSAVVTLSGADIVNAQVSSDGQWILFVANFSDHETLQLVRADGKYLQTLYCGHAYQIDAVQWSPDQKTIVIEENASSLTSLSISILSLGSGAFQLFLHGAMLDMWLDASHLVVENALSSTSSDPSTFYLTDTMKSNMPLQDLPVIWKGQASCHTVIATTNPNVLYLSRCAYIDNQTNARQPSTIHSIPVSGALPAGWPEQIVLDLDPNHDITQLTLVNPQELIYVTGAGIRPA